VGREEGEPWRALVRGDEVGAVGVGWIRRPTRSLINGINGGIRGFECIE
jgi:hypothetical protein